MPTLDLANALKISAAPFRLPPRQKLSREAGGKPRGADLGDPLWVADVTCSMLTLAEARAIDALINSLDGVKGSFYLYDPAAMYPLADPGGVILGSATVTIAALGADTLSLDGLPDGYALSAGDNLAFDTGSDPDVHRCFHQVVAGGTADGDGLAANIKVRPFIQPGASTGLVVTLKRPACEMIIVPGSYQPGQVRATIKSVAFQAQQVP